MYVCHLVIDSGVCIDINVLRFNTQYYFCTVYICCMFFVRVLVSFLGNGFNVRSYMYFIVHITCFIGLVKTCLVLCISCLSLFLLCSQIVFEEFAAFAFWSFVLLELWSFVLYPTSFLWHFFVLAFRVFLKICFCLSEWRVCVVLGWSILLCDVRDDVLNTFHCLINIFRWF